MLYSRTVVSCVCAVSVTGRPHTVPPGGRFLSLHAVSLGHRCAAPCVDTVHLPGLEAPATGRSAGPPRARAPAHVTGPCRAVPPEGGSPSVIAAGVGAVVLVTNDTGLLYLQGATQATCRTLAPWFNDPRSTRTAGTRSSSQRPVLGGAGCWRQHLCHAAGFCALACHLPTVEPFAAGRRAL